MSNEEILALSDGEFERLYLERLYQLRGDISSIESYRKKKNKKFSKNQTAIIKMINGSSSHAIIEVNGICIQFARGNRKFGLKHILMRHFCEEREGRIGAMDIISIERFLGKNILFGEDKTKYGYIYNKNGTNEKYKLLLFRDTNCENVLSVYKIELQMGTGANSPVDYSTETSEGELIETDK